MLGCLVGVAAAAETDGKRENIKRENIEWTNLWIPDLAHNDLPRVLLVGDSICNAYYQAVADALKGKAYVAKLATSSSLGDPALLDQVKFLLANYQFAVIHFNNGLHGFEYTEEQYQADIPKLLELVRRNAPNAKLIWATSTPMRNPANLNEINPENARVTARNKIVAAVAAQAGIPVNDLYGLVEKHPEYWSNDGVHFNPEGQAVEARQVTDCILKALGNP
jgi:lysophospholipase L1-like esterase